MPDNRPAYIVYELIDPRPGHDLRYVGYGRGDRPWKNLKGSKNSRLRCWLDELKEAGLRPIPIWDGLVRITIGLTDARSIAAFRRRQLQQDGIKLVDGRRTSLKGLELKVTDPNGHTSYYPSVCSAAKSLNISKTTAVRWANKARKQAYRDKSGFIWRIK